jgi:hypothetical protein
MGTPFFVTPSTAESSDFLILELHERRSWQDIMTLDESWFCLHTDHELIWAQPDVKISERERHTVQS